MLFANYVRRKTHGKNTASMDDLGMNRVPSLRALTRIPKVLKNPIPVFNENLKEFGDPYCVDMGGGRLGILTTRPEISQHILQKNHRAYSKSDIQTKKLADFLGKGLLTLEGKEWLRQRRLIQPGFKKERIEGIRGRMIATVNDALDELESRIEHDPTVDMHSEMMNLAFRIVAESLLGTKVDAEEINTLRRGVDLSQHILIKLIRLPFMEWYFNLNGSVRKANRAIESSHQVILQYLEARRRSGVDNEDLLQMMLDARYEDTGESMTNRQLLFELMVMFVAGHETTANALTWALVLLSKHTEELQKLRSDQSGYDMNVINETLRYYPPAWLTDREALQDDHIAGYRIPKGSLVISYIYGIHHHPDLWDQPELFNPARFDQETELSGKFLPFGAGPRLCIGMQFAIMEMQIVLNEFVKRFDFSLLQKEVPMKPLITLNPRGKVGFSLAKR